MWPVSEAFLAAHRAGAQQVTCRVELWRSGLRLATLDAVSGSVSVDSRRAVRRTITAELVDRTGTLVPADADGLLVPTGVQLRAWRGIRLPNGTTEEVPLGVFRVTEPEFEVTDSGLRITVEGSDEAKTVQEARLTQAWSIPAGTPVGAAILALLADRHPTLPTRDDSSPSVRLGASMVIPAGADSDPWQACLDLAAQFGLDLAIDASGTAVVRALNTATVPVVSYERGAEAVLLRLNRKLSVETTYSGVVVTSETDDAEGAAPIQAEAWDTDPSSPTYYLGPYGRKPYFIASQLITTVAQARDTAQAQLPQVTGILDQIEWDQVVNPALDAGDVVGLLDPELKVDATLTVVALDIPLTVDGVMTAVTRSRAMRPYAPPVATVTEEAVSPPPDPDPDPDPPPEPPPPSATALYPATDLYPATTLYPAE